MMSKAPSWDDQLAFLAVMETGSLAGAARRLGVAHPTVRSRIEALEDRLGTVLFTRSGTGLEPTPHARTLADPARAMAHAAALFDRIAVAEMSDVAGIVRLGVSEFIGIEVVPPILARLRQDAPQLSVELVLSNRQADVVGQEVDVAIRNALPTQRALVARRLPAIPLGLYATKDYLDRHGQPGALDNLKQHDVIGPDRDPADTLIARQVFPDHRPADFALRTDSHPAQLAAARAGLGIAVVQVPVGEADPELRRVLPETAVGEIPVYVITHENLRNAPRVRALFDALVAGLSPRLSRGHPET
jgi:DNA-binding transcriptional LysR family regulator|tara:strand:+ start:895 stop:1803 length:909 start_codon:yes stop_codon:yes gene_type:complete